jgi:hypothetical protein
VKRGAVLACTAALGPALVFHELKALELVPFGAVLWSWQARVQVARRSGQCRWQWLGKHDYFVLCGDVRRRLGYFCQEIWGVGEPRVGKRLTKEAVE